MLINKIKPATKTILNILQEKHNIFDLQQKVNISVHATRQVIIRLMEKNFVCVCGSEFDFIKRRHIKFYKITNNGKKFLNQLNEFFEKEENKTKVKKVSSCHYPSLGKTKAFIKTLTKKATPWDALLKS